MIAPIRRFEANAAAVAQYLAFVMNGADFCVDLGHVYTVVRKSLPLTSAEAACPPITVSGREARVVFQHRLPYLRPDQLPGPHFIVVFPYQGLLAGLVVDDVPPRVGEACAEAAPHARILEAAGIGLKAAQNMLRIGETWCLMLDMRMLLPGSAAG